MSLLSEFLPTGGLSPGVCVCARARAHSPPRGLPVVWFSVSSVLQPHMHITLSAPFEDTASRLQIPAHSDQIHLLCRSLESVASAKGLPSVDVPLFFFRPLPPKLSRCSVGYTPMRCNIC
jgi:hypothetical protein